MWEYKRIDIKFHTFPELNDKLNALGKDNWEIIYYQEEKLEKNGSNYNANILIKRISA